MTDVAETKQTGKMTGKDAKQQIEKLLPEVTDEERYLLAELIGQTQATSMSCLQAQKKVTAAYQERQRQYDEFCRQIEENAPGICAQAREKARRCLEKAVQEAGEAYVKAKANRVYQDTVNEAPGVRHETIPPAWEETRKFRKDLQELSGRNQEIN